SFLAFLPQKVEAGNLLDIINSGQRPACTGPGPCCYDGTVAWQGECVSTQQMCGNGKNISFNNQTGECYCYKTLVMVTEGGVKSCVEPVVEWTIHAFSGQPQPPLFADGQTKTQFNVEGKFVPGNDPVNLRFEIRAGINPTHGKITKVEGDVDSGYTVFYQTPDFRDIDVNSWLDTLVITYDKYNSTRTGDKSYSIDLTLEKGGNIEIEKTGFADKSQILKMKTKKAELCVYTKSNGQEAPVVNARISSDIVGAEKYYDTDKDGCATIENPFITEVPGAETPTTYVELGLDSSVKDRVDKSFSYYNQVHVDSYIINDFIVNFPKYLAQEDDNEEVKSLIRGMKSLSYALMFTYEGGSFTKGKTGINEQMAKATKVVISDLLGILMDMTGYTDWVKNYLEKYGADKLAKISAEEKQEALTIVNNLAPSYLKASLAGLKAGVFKAFQHIDPKVFTIVLEELGFDYKNLSEDTIKKLTASLSNPLRIEQSIKTAFDNSYDKNVTREMLDIMEIKVQDRQFLPEYMLEDSAINSMQEQYREFLDSYKNKTYASATLDVTDKAVEQVKFVFNSASRIVTFIFFPQFMAQVNEMCVAANNAYKVFSKVADAADLAIWYEAYNEGVLRTSAGVRTIMGTSFFSQADSPTKNFALVDSVTAQEGEGDLLDQLFQNEVEKGSADRDLAIEYYEKQNSLDFYKNIARLSEIAAEYNPDNKEIQETSKMFNAELDEAENFIDKNEKKVLKLDIVDPNYKPKIKPSDGFKFDFDWTKLKPVGIGLVILILIVLLLKVKAIRKIVLILGGVGLVGFIIFFFVSNNVPGIDLKTKTGGLFGGSGGDDRKDKSTIEASSYLPQEGIYSYTPDLAFDETITTSWVEGDSGNGKDEWIKFNFDKKQEVNGIGIVPGYGSSEDGYFENNRVKQLRVEFSNDPAEFFTLSDEYRSHDLYFDPVKTDYVRVVIVDIYPGNKYNDAAISEIVFY
ncbi:discoidin domain-containing protein, partial [Patescibacteria group bacterium]|nr:discoidin domain-containing protein [Patescibacteria group bacterium]MBU1896034.1 discoidin domain-containing protein [Patescibacteria group bacterium]